MQRKQNYNWGVTSPVWIAIIKESSKNPQWRGPGENNTLPGCRVEIGNSTYTEQYTAVFQKKTKATNDPVFPGLREQPQRTRIWKATCSITEAAVGHGTTAKIWKQSVHQGEMRKEEPLHVHHGTSEWNNTKGSNLHGPINASNHEKGNSASKDTDQMIRPTGGI